jgi:predicted transcriptional regulator
LPKTGSDAEQLVKEAALRLLQEETRFVEAVKLGESQLDRGEYLTHEEVGESIERLFRS